MWKLPRYKKNLSLENNSVYSYNTKVAEIDHDNFKVKPLGYWSSTTTKHINYATKELRKNSGQNYTLCKE